MIKKISIKIAKSLGVQLQANNNEIEVYTYGLEIFLGTAFKFILLVILSLVMEIFWPTILVLSSFAGFRIFGGGVHLSTYFRCLVVGLAVILGSAKLATLPVSTTLLIVSFIMVSLLAVYTIITRVPAGTEKKAIANPGDITKQKRRTALFFSLWIASFILLMWYRKSVYSFAVILGAFGGIFLITPWGYWIVSSLDNMLDRLGRRCLGNV